MISVLAVWVLVISVGAIVHTYLLFPWMMKVLSRGKSLAVPAKEEMKQWPKVTVLMAVYNEEAIIKEKLDSLDKVDYPIDKWRIYIGSDASDDRTNSIVSQWGQGKEYVHFKVFEKRHGKVKIINQLVSEAVSKQPAGPQHIFLLTDASVMLDPEVVRTLVRHFRDEKVALVDTHMINLGSSHKDISASEEQYISREVLIKHREGLLGGVMMGPFGGCFALRSDYFTPVPDTFRVDDFYVAMQALKRGGKLISDLDAKVYEAIPHDIMEEYRRKRRISSGNFQNLTQFSSMLVQPPLWRAFVFFSHKVLRWMGPLIMLIGVLSLSVLALKKGGYYSIIWWIALLGTLGVSLADIGLSKRHIHLKYFRLIRYFIMMNIALLEGFIEYLKGIKTNVWQPPKRKAEYGDEAQYHSRSDS